MNRSLIRLIGIHKARNLNNFSFPVSIHDIVTPPNPITYQSSDFGNNVINNHFSKDSWHSERCQMIFNYLMRNYNCTSYQSYKTPSIGGGYIFKGQFLDTCKTVNASLIFIPYMNAATAANGDYNDFILPVCSHYNNDATDGIIGNGDKHDIPGLEDGQVLSEVVACSARSDTPSKFKEDTSHGKGMEFFVDCSPYGLDEDYPEKELPDAFAELHSEDGEILTSTIHTQFANKLNVGEEITIRYSSDSLTWKTTLISEILSSNAIKVNPVIDPIITSGIYGWKLYTLGETLWGQAQSWAVPIIAAQLMTIRIETGEDWNTVREAAKATARRRPTGIPEIDNTNWDEWRGFGQIRVNNAINYINNNG